MFYYYLFILLARYIGKTNVAVLRVTFQESLSCSARKQLDNKHSNLAFGVYMTSLFAI